MGNNLFDQYSLLHYSTGVVAYFWGIPFIYWLGAHSLFEFLENTRAGIRIINSKLRLWPGGKPRADSFTNIIGDSISGMLGWYCAYRLDEIGKRDKWYDAK